MAERTKVVGAHWRPIATVRTNRTGRFTFKALRGPSRTLRFRFGGGDTIRGRTALVRLGVRASTTLRASRSSVVNGEDVTFRGRVRGAPIPATGKLIELQARTRGGWRTFATTRASVRNRPVGLRLSVLRHARHRPLPLPRACPEGVRASRTSRGPAARWAFGSEGSRVRNFWASRRICLLRGV